MPSNFALLRIADRLPWRIARGVRHLFPPTHGHCSVVSTDPAIVAIPEDFYDEPGLWQPFFDAIAKTKVHFICLVLADIEGYDWDYKKHLSRVLNEHKRRYPNHHFTFLANDSAQEQIFAGVGASSVFVSHNALVDENLFTIREGCVKKHDAIYNAVMMPYKRHVLASKIGSLAVVTYFKPGHEEYFGEIKSALQHATWLNFPTRAPVKSDGYRPIPKNEIPLYLNEAKVGLCLSEREGAMFASIEYLLCGLPIVSTPSSGGRDVFFEPDYAQIVEPTPDAVQRGVTDMLERKIPADHIRQQTLRKISEHRGRIIELVIEIYQKQGMRIERQEAHSRLFSHPLYQVSELHQIAAAL